MSPAIRWLRDATWIGLYSPGALPSDGPIGLGRTAALARADARQCGHSGAGLIPRVLTWDAVRVICAKDEVTL